MNCTHCKVCLEEVLSKTQMQHKTRLLSNDLNYAVFCSRSCSTTYNNLNKKIGKAKNGINKLCKTESCTNTIPKHGKKFCVKCRETLDKNILHLLNPTKSELEYSVRSSPYSYIRWHARTVVAKDWVKECASCKYNKHVELAHIKGIAKFSNESTISEINDPSNLVFLCPNCHWEYDRGRLELKWYPREDSNLH